MGPPRGRVELPWVMKLAGAELEVSPLDSSAWLFLVIILHNPAFLARVSQLPALL